MIVIAGTVVTLHWQLCELALHIECRHIAAEHQGRLSTKVLTTRQLPLLSEPELKLGGVNVGACTLRFQKEL